MSDPTPNDQQQFEQVLGRLDALIKRSHHEAAPLPPLAAAGGEEMAPLELSLPAEDAPADASEPHLPFVVVESAPIPILTEVYQGTAAGPAAAPSSEPAADSLSPALLELVDRVVKQELAELEQSLRLRLHREIVALLQQGEPPPDSR